MLSSGISHQRSPTFGLFLGISVQLSIVENTPFKTPLSLASSALGSPSRIVSGIAQTTTNREPLLHGMSLLTVRNTVEVSIIYHRYLATRIWFCVSADGLDKEMLKRSIVVDAQEVVRAEIWRIVVDSYKLGGNRIPIRESFYVLYDTCEVIGHPPPSRLGRSTASLASALQVDMRSDRSLQASLRLQSGDNAAGLLSLIKWNNPEEYLTGMSRLWLARIRGDGSMGDYKKKVGIRYVLASVVENRSV